MNGQISHAETPKANVVSSEIKNILKELDESEFVHAQEHLSKRLDKIHSELGKIELRAWLGSEPKLHIERMLGDIVGERLDSHLRSIHETLHEVCVSILEISREIRKMAFQASDIPTGRNDCGERVNVTGPTKKTVLADLSNREREVVEQLLSGKTNREISVQLNISERTVKNHLWKIYKKMGVENRSQLLGIFAGL